VRKLRRVLGLLLLARSRGLRLWQRSTSGQVLKHTCSGTKLKLECTPSQPSFWLEHAAAAYPPLSHDLDVDVAVVGAGITGVTAAHLLKQARRTVALLEMNRVGYGATGYTTAKLTVASLRGVRAPARARHRDRGEPGAREKGAVRLGEKGNPLKEARAGPFAREVSQEETRDSGEGCPWRPGSSSLARQSGPLPRRNPKKG
jgi:FAD dependent oxidoreductase